MSESHSHSTTHKSHSTQTHQGNRPYGGVAPKGMTNAQYAELEKKVGNASQMSKSICEKVDQETQKLQINTKQRFMHLKRRSNHINK